MEVHFTEVHFLYWKWYPITLEWYPITLEWYPITLDVVSHRVGFRQAASQGVVDKCP
jgi:hypothetical protein